MELVKLGRKGQLSIPRSILRRLGIEGGTLMRLDVTAHGVIELRPVGAFPVETYSDARLKEFEAANRMKPAEKAMLAKALRRN